MKLQKITPLFLVLLLVAACAPPAPDVDGAKKTIEEFNAASMDAMMSGQVERAAAFYAEDAISMPPNEQPIKGKQAITEWMTAMSKSGVKMTAVKFMTDSVIVDGKIACEIGSYEMSMEIPGMGNVDDTGNYVSIWKQQEDKSWKLTAELWNTRTPMPPPEPPKGAKKK